jgi:hypothetical protein
MFMMEGETANGGITDTAAINTQLKRWVAASRAAWTNTALKVFVNFHYPYVLDFYEFCAGFAAVLIGGPDPEVPILAGGAVNTAAGNYRPIDGNEWFRGMSGGNKSWAPGGTDTLGYPARDYREVIGWAAEQQGLGYSPIDGFSTEPQQIWEFQVNTMHARYIDWSTDDNRPIASQRFTTGVRPFISSVSGRVYQVNGVTPLPSSYALAA